MSPFALAAEFDQVFDRTHLELMLSAKLPQLRQPGHPAFVVHDFNNDCRGFEAR